jgi:hypothetical protein
MDHSDGGSSGVQRTMCRHSRSSSSFRTRIERLASCISIRNMIRDAMSEAIANMNRNATGLTIPPPTIWAMNKPATTKLTDTALIVQSVMDKLTIRIRRSKTRSSWIARRRSAVCIFSIRSSNQRDRSMTRARRPANRFKSCPSPARRKTGATDSWIVWAIAAAEPSGIGIIAPTTRYLDYSGRMP